MVVTVSLGRSYASSICFIFRLNMQSNALEKSTRFLSSRGSLHELLGFDKLSESMMLWIAFSENHFDSF